MCDRRSARFPWTCSDLLFSLALMWSGVSDVGWRVWSMCRYCMGMGIASFAHPFLRSRNRSQTWTKGDVVSSEGGTRFATAFFSKVLSILATPSDGEIPCTVTPHPPLIPNPSPLTPHPPLIPNPSPLTPHPLLIPNPSPLTPHPPLIPNPSLLALPSSLTPHSSPSPPP